MNILVTGRGSDRRGLGSFLDCRTGIACFGWSGSKAGSGPGDLAWDPAAERLIGLHSETWTLWFISPGKISFGHVGPAGEKARIRDSRAKTDAPAL